MLSETGPAGQPMADAVASLKAEASTQSQVYRTAWRNPKKIYLNSASIRAVYIRSIYIAPFTRHKLLLMLLLKLACRANVWTSHHRTAKC